MPLDLSTVWQHPHFRDALWLSRYAAAALTILATLVVMSQNRMIFYQNNQTVFVVEGKHKVRMDRIRPDVLEHKFYKLYELVVAKPSFNQIRKKKPARPHFQGQIPVFFVGPELGEQYMARQIFDESVKVSPDRERPMFRFFAFDFDDEPEMKSGTATWAQHRFVVAGMEYIMKHYRQEPSIVIAHGVGVQLAMSALPRINWPNPTGSLVDLMLLSASTMSLIDDTDHKMYQFNQLTRRNWHISSHRLPGLGIVSFGRGVSSVGYNSTRRVPFDTIDDMPDACPHYLQLLRSDGYLSHVAELLVYYAEQKRKHPKRPGNSIVAEHYRRADEKKWRPIQLSLLGEELRPGVTYDNTFSPSFETLPVYEGSCPTVRSLVPPSQCFPEEPVRTRTVSKDQHQWFTVNLKKNEWVYLWIHSDCVTSATLIRDRVYIRRKEAVVGKPIEFGIFEASPTEYIRLLLVINTAEQCRVRVETTSSWHVFGNVFGEGDEHQSFVAFLHITLLFMVIEGEQRKRRAVLQTRIHVAVIVGILVYGCGVFDLPYVGFVLGAMCASLFIIAVNGLNSALLRVQHINVIGLVHTIFKIGDELCLVIAIVFGIPMTYSGVLMAMLSNLTNYRFVVLLQMSFVVGPSIRRYARVTVPDKVPFYEWDMPFFWLLYFYFAIEAALRIRDYKKAQDQKLRSQQPVAIQQPVAMPLRPHRGRRRSPPARPLPPPIVVEPPAASLLGRWRKTAVRDVLIVNALGICFWWIPYDYQYVLALFVMTYDRYSGHNHPAELLKLNADLKQLEREYQAQEAEEEAKEESRKD